MKRKFISALLFGALCITPSSVLVSCDDYDSDIENLQQQITANAQTLEQLSNEKLKNVAAEIEALKAAQKGLEDAYKNADEANKQAVIAAAQALVDKAKADLESALDAANKRIDEQGKTVSTLLQNDAEMQIAITTAKEKAEQAYGLAEQAKALSETNKEELTKVAENLKTIKETLESQINALGDQVSALAEKVGKLESALTAQEASLKEYINAQNEAQDNKLEEQAKKIEDLKTSIEKLKSEVAKNKTELESLVQTEVKKLSDKIGAVESALNTKIEDLQTAYNNLDTKDKELQAQIDEIEKNLDNAQETLNKEITEKIKAVNGLVDVLFADLKSLITGVIVQDAESEFEAVYAKVTAWQTNPGDAGKTYFDTQADAQNNKYVYFPYKGAKDGEKLLQNQYNVQEKAGFFFATINPNTVDFNGQQLTLLNSEDKQPSHYKVEKAATANKLITRAAAKNGLYEMAVTNSFNKSGNVMEAPETNSKVVYALAAADTTTRGKDGEVLGRKVYSKYEIKLNATNAKALANANFELVGKDAEKGTEGAAFDYRFSEAAATQGDLQGTLELKPFFDAHKAKGAAKVYRKYLVCTGAVKPMGKTTDAESKAAADAMNANKGFQAVLAEGDANFNEVPVTISEKYNGWIFTYDFYIWNYNGSILKNTYKVIYTRPMIQTQTIAMTHTPQSNAAQNVSESNPAFSSLLCMTSENEKFVKNAASVHIGAATVEGTTIEGGEFTKVTFTNGKESALKTKTIVLNQNAASASFGDDFKASDLKTLTLTYDPSKVTYDKVYTLPISFKNPQGNLVNTVNVQFTMKRPTIWDVMIQRITNAFEGNITIAWAAYDGTKGYAYYDLSGSYNNVNKDLDNIGKVESKILFKDLTVYSQANKNVDYKPLKGDLGNYTSPFEFNHLLYVPNAAVDADSKGAKEAYLYNLEAGVKYFGLDNLYAATEKFQLKWYSPIYHADLTIKKLNIGYPGKLDVTNADITSDDPSKSGTQNIKYLENKDERIVKVELKPIMNGNVFADANTGLFTKYQVSEDGKKIEFETTEKAALTGPATVKFHMVVTDVFGCVKTHELSVTVDPNEHHAQKK